MCKVQDFNTFLNPFLMKYIKKVRHERFKDVDTLVELQNIH